MGNFIPIANVNFSFEWFNEKFQKRDILNVSQMCVSVRWRRVYFTNIVIMRCPCSAKVFLSFFSSFVFSYLFYIPHKNIFFQGNCLFFSSFMRSLCTYIRQVTKYFSVFFSFIHSLLLYFNFSIFTYLYCGDVRSLCCYDKEENIAEKKNFFLLSPNHQLIRLTWLRLFPSLFGLDNGIAMSEQQTFAGWHILLFLLLLLLLLLLVCFVFKNIIISAWCRWW